ncbi:unnamed protein product [Gadus morhua 'NCC']
MGRLDEAAKLKVVELRKAGLSFRKIKAVLELENIKVSAQAIYLYLREFQGRPAGRGRAGGSGSSVALETPQGPARPKPWNNSQLQNLLREASHQANCIVALEFAKKTTAGSEARPNSSGSSDAGVGGRSEQPAEGNREEADIQIVSVTSLAQNSQPRPLQSPMARAAAGAHSTTVATSLAALRRRVSPSPAATNPILAARKRLLDKALSHRAKQSFQPMGPPSRRYQPSVAGEDLRRVMARDLEKYSNDNTFMTGQPGGTNDPRRGVPQRPALSIRSPQPPPRVGVRPPALLTSPASRTPQIRLHAPGGPSNARRDGGIGPSGSISPQQKEAPTRSLGGGGGPGAGGGGGLQDQVQLLATEVRGLGLAVKMLVEQQSRLEREQTQQTRVQKQILGALQGLASSLGPCRGVPARPDKAPTPPPAMPTAPAAAAAFSEDPFTYSQGAYTPCNQAQSSYSSMDGLEIVEAFKLPELRSAGVNGFPPCSNAGPLSHSYTQAQPYTTAYTQQHTQAAMPCYTQSLAQTYVQANAQSFRGLDAKVSEFPSGCLEGSLQDCSIPTEQVMKSTQSSMEDQLNIIKVEET